jgi:nicotinamidase/pyrazinamidase
MKAPPFPDPSATALLVVDMQRDCMDDGALAIDGANAIVPVVNHYVAKFSNVKSAIYFARDHHPLDHCSFQRNGGRWPVHCVTDTDGAKFARGLIIPHDAVIVSKGMEAAHEALSAFEGTALAQLLHERSVQHLWIAGLAMEHSIRASALDGLKAEFAVTLLVDAIRARDDTVGGADRALAEMLTAGAQIHSWARPRRLAS